MLAAGKIPALLLIFTAKSHDSREAGGGGRVQTDSKSPREKGKKNLCRRQREQGGGEKNKVELKVFHFKCCGRTARNGCCNQNKPGAPTGPGNEKDDRK